MERRSERVPVPVYGRRPDPSKITLEDVEYAIYILRVFMLMSSQARSVLSHVGGGLGGYRSREDALLNMILGNLRLPNVQQQLQQAQEQAPELDEGKLERALERLRSIAREARVGYTEAEVQAESRGDSGGGGGAAEGEEEVGEEEGE